MLDYKPVAQADLNNFVADVQRVVQAVLLITSYFDSVALARVNAFATAAKKVADTIKSAMDGFKDLAAIVSIPSCDLRSPPSLLYCLVWTIWNDRRASNRRR